MSWILVLALYTGSPDGGLSTQQVGPFATEEGCREAGEKARQQLAYGVYRSTVRTVCLPIADRKLK